MGKFGPTGFSHNCLSKPYKENYDSIFRQGAQPKPVKTNTKKVAKAKAKPTKAVRNTDVPKTVPERVSSMQETMLKERVVHEQLNAKLARTQRNEVIDMNKLSEEQQRKLVFETFPGDVMGLVTGGKHHNDYDAQMPTQAE